MNPKLRIALILLFLEGFSGESPSEMATSLNYDKYRPQIHFSISKNWINDPNGMFYLDGKYHLYYQYNPNNSTWGSIHWGHSVSTDLVTWTELPIAIYPDEFGQIWSGSAVVDFTNSAGFKQGHNTPVIAVYTDGHGPQPQQQSIAYSNDNGRTFAKYDRNPVIQNPGIEDFRDPKVIRYNNDSWVLVLAAKHKVMFYGSKDFKTWSLLSEFGSEPFQGSHAGTWECPELMKMTVEDEIVWVLVVSISPGGPNGGSATQYFIGNFDGKKFTSGQMSPLWLDWGADNYASVSFFNEPKKRRVIMGWMNNWDYAAKIPTEGWRGQMTLPRVLELKNVDGLIRMQSTPAPELGILNKSEQVWRVTEPVEIRGDELFSPTDQIFWTNPLMYLDLTFDIKEFGETSSFDICFINSLKQEVCTGFDKGQNRNVFVDRSQSGVINFSATFSRRPHATREINDPSIRFQIYLDVSSIEVFVDSGLTVLTNLFYSDEPLTSVEIRHHGQPDKSKLTLTSSLAQGLKSMSEVSKITPQSAASRTSRWTLVGLLLSVIMTRLLL